MKTELTHARLLELLHYDPETGDFTWRISRPNCRVGDPVGYSSGKRGYRQAMLDGGRYYLHRLAWLYTHGVWPTGVIDHRDHSRGNNRIANLRDVPQSVNLQNRVDAQKGSEVGLLGVSRAKNKFRAAIKINGKFTHIGIFTTAIAAHSAYLSRKKSAHPEAFT